MMHQYVMALKYNCSEKEILLYLKEWTKEVNPLISTIGLEQKKNSAEEGG